MSELPKPPPTIVRKCFNGFAIVVLAGFIVFSLVMLLGTFYIPELRERAAESDDPVIEWEDNR